MVISWNQAKHLSEEGRPVFPMATVTSALLHPDKAPADVVAATRCVRPGKPKRVLFVVDEAFQLCEETMRTFLAALDKVYGHEMFTARNCSIWIVGKFFPPLLVCPGPDFPVPALADQRLQEIRFNFNRWAASFLAGRSG